MSIKLNAANNALLTYALTTDPDPLQVSPATSNPAIGSLTIVASNTTDNAIYVDQIMFSFDLGTLAQNLTSDGTSILAAVTDVGTGAPQWQIAVTSTSGTFVAVAKPLHPSDNEITTDGLVFQIYGIQVNQQVGTATITLTENSSTNNTNFTLKTNTYQTSKFPYGFFFDNFTASVPAVQDGSPVTLTWNGADEATYTLLYGSSQPVNVTDVRSWISPSLHNTTTFLLRATIQSQGETVETYLDTTVIVLNPDLTVTSLTVSQNATVGGTLQVTGAMQGIGMCPVGSVIMYSGNVGNTQNFNTDGSGITGTPFQGWQVCNGNNNSPDLRDKFIPAAGGQYTVGQTGGADQITLTNPQMPQHSHGGNTDQSTASLNYSGVAFNSGGTSSGIMVNRGTDDPNGNRPNLLTTVGWSDISVLNHSHGIELDGGNQSHENRPQFYALAYLIKTF